MGDIRKGTAMNQRKMRIGMSIRGHGYHPAAWRHLYDEAPRYAREWTDVAMAERLAMLYHQLAGLQCSPEMPLTAVA